MDPENLKMDRGSNTPDEPEGTVADFINSNNFHAFPIVFSNIFFDFPRLPLISSGISTHHANLQFTYLSTLWVGLFFRALDLHCFGKPVGVIIRIQLLTVCCFIVGRVRGSRRPQVGIEHFANLSIIKIKVFESLECQLFNLLVK